MLLLLLLLCDEPFSSPSSHGEAILAQYLIDMIKPAKLWCPVAFYIYLKIMCVVCCKNYCNNPREVISNTLFCCISVQYTKHPSVYVMWKQINSSDSCIREEHLGTIRTVLMQPILNDYISIQDSARIMLKLQDMLQRKTCAGQSFLDIKIMARNNCKVKC